jgi:hypothetical protein
VEGDVVDGDVGEADVVVLGGVVVVLEGVGVVDDRGGFVTVATRVVVVAAGLVVLGVQVGAGEAPVLLPADGAGAASAGGRPLTGAGLSGWRGDSPAGTVPTPSPLGVTPSR